VLLLQHMESVQALTRCMVLACSSRQRASAEGVFRASWTCAQRLLHCRWWVIIKVNTRTSAYSNQSVILRVPLLQIGKLVVTGSEDGTLFIWDPKTGNSKHHLKGRLHCRELVTVTQIQCLH